jgi:osmotically-inducible protein OsmY
MIKKIFNIITFSCLLLIYSCSPAGILASGGATTMVVAEGDKTLGSVIDDTTIKFNISSKFIQSEKALFLNINVNVINGRVLLTGIVENQEIRINSIKIVWEVEGVNEVINEIEIGDKTTIKEYANDLWINTQVKTLVAKTIGLRVLSYNFETIKGKVYIAGITSRPEQLKKIIEAMETIKGVREIVNYVIVKN